MSKSEASNAAGRRLGRSAAVGALLAFACAAAPGAPPPKEGPAGGDLERSITIGGAIRSYVLHVPHAYDGKRLFPLLLVLHGGGGNARATAQITRFSALADEKGFLAVYPNGAGLWSDRLLTWNSGNCCGWAVNHQTNDMLFLRRLVTVLERQWKIDTRRIFATGISNGGMMSYRLGCEMSDVVAAVAPVAGALNVEPCAPQEPVSVIAFNGTADEHVPYSGGQPHRRFDRNPRVDKSVNFAISFWTRHDGCAVPPARKENGSVLRELYAPCKNGAAVELVTIRGGGHVWPGGEKWAPWADEPMHEISATRAVWQFFEKHPKARPD